MLCLIAIEKKIIIVSLFTNVTKNIEAGSYHNDELLR